MKKMPYHTLKIAFSLLLCILAISCSKDNPTPEPTSEELILGKWYVVLVTTADGVVQELNDCEKESHYEFEPDGQMIERSFNHDGSACRGTVVTAEYNMVSGGKKIIFIRSDGTANTVNIITLNETTLEMEVASGMKALLEKR